MKRRVVSLLIPLSLISFSTYGAAQATPDAIASVSADARVRITAPQLSGSRITGKVTHVAADTLYIAPNRNRLVAVPIAAITAAEVSRGKRRWVGAMKGAGIGSLAGGAVLGTLIWTGDPDCDYCLPGREPGAALAGAIIGAVFAAPTGAVVGAIIGSERWEPVGRKLTLAVVPSTAGSPGLRLVLSTR